MYVEPSKPFSLGPKYQSLAGRLTLGFSDVSYALSLEKPRFVRKRSLV
jgi:hypothetical protein